MNRRRIFLCFVATFFALVAPLVSASGAESWPALPAKNATVSIPAQEWPQKPGPRQVKISVHFPGGRLENVAAETGLMLTLHNWGGTSCAGTANPDALANQWNVVAVCVNYLQSGPKASSKDPEPYDFGYLQSLDALRALYFVFNGLKKLDRPFAAGRIYATGGSGGGNVTLMANKLAPRTFACIVDLSGMNKLSHDVAFNLPGGSGLDARWSRDPKSKNFLSVDQQELRFLGHPQHLRTMKQLKNSCKIIVVHGTGDRTCPFPDAREMVEKMQAAKLDVEPHFIAKKDLDGGVYTNTGHSLGNRTQIVFRVAKKYLSPKSPTCIVRAGKTDFDRRDENVRYRTTHGAFVISYKSGFPIGRFEPEKKPVAYDEHQDLTYFHDDSLKRHPVKTVEDWSVRRRHILANMQLVMGKLPGPIYRTPLDVKQVEEIQVGELLRRKITYQTDPDDRLAAYLFLPKSGGKKRPAILCLHQTTKIGKNEPAGLGGNANMHYALHLAKRGYVTLAPDYPSLGEHDYDFDPRHGYSSGTMKAVWDNIRSIDLLQSLKEVDPRRIGCLGHSLGGHSAMFTAAFEPRIKVIVSSCGFTRFHKDDVPSWTGRRYMPRIASVYKNDADRVPFDFTEIVASFAPRPFLACAAKQDRDFDVRGVRDVIASARPIYALYGKSSHLQAYYPDSGHGFPADARETAYKFFDRHLK